LKWYPVDGHEVARPDREEPKGRMRIPPHEDVRSMEVAHKYFAMLPQARISGVWVFQEVNDACLQALKVGHCVLWTQGKSQIFPCAHEVRR